MTDERPPTVEELDTLHLDPAPVRDLLAAGHTIKRRRRTIISSVLAAAVIVAGVSVATAGSSPSQSRDVGAADQSDVPETQPFPDPPAGEKWAGMNGVVVAVPSDWPVLESACGDGSPGVVLDGTMSAVSKCMYYEDVRVSFIPNSDDSDTVREFDKCFATTESCLATKAFPEQHVALRLEVEGPDAADVVKRILDSAMVLPSGWTTVPFGQWDDTPMTRAAALRQAGFDVEGLQDVGDTYGPVASEPAVGSPVREGTTITLRPLSQEQEPKAHELDVSLVDRASSDDSDLAPGSARWHEEQRTVAYTSTAVYNGCPPVAVHADTVGSVLNLTFTDRSSIDPGFCAGFNSSNAVFTISGLTEAPTELTVTEDGETRTVAVE